MKILSIGNSFSRDAQRYLHEIAKNNGVDLYTVNLYIGGCSLEMHYNNIVENNANYDLEVNGQLLDERISIVDALLRESWDYITLQQVSQKSGDYSSYNPYVKEIFNYAKKFCPSAKMLIHQTWAYEDKSQKLFETPYKSADEMCNAIISAYDKCFNDLDFYGLIPSGKAMMNATKFGIPKIHRDGFHASLGAGRYLLGLVWYKSFTGNDISNDNFDLLDEPITKTQRKIVIKAVNSAYDKTPSI